MLQIWGLFLRLFFYGVESSHPPATPAPVFYGVESSDHTTIGFATVPPPPWGVRGPYPRPARRLWADFPDSDDEVPLMDASMQTTVEQPNCMELLNTSLKIVASVCPGAPLPVPQPNQHVQQLLLEPLLVEQPRVDAPSALNMGLHGPFFPTMWPRGYLHAPHCEGNYLPAPSSGFRGWAPCFERGQRVS